MINHLVQALRNYRIRTEGQFGQVSESVLPLTQDAADVIEQLQRKLEQQMVLSLDGNSQRTGFVSAVRWIDVAKMLEALPDNKGYKVVTFVPNEYGLEVVWESKR